jgi:lipoprotein signal peptidase
MGAKRGNILTENIVFIVITLLFIGALFGFVIRSSSSTRLTEEVYAKKFALIIDSLKPDTILEYSVKDLTEKAVNIPENQVIKIIDNKVLVKLSENSGYSYSFFNSANVRIGEINVEKGTIKISVKKEIEEAENVEIVE